MALGNTLREARMRLGLTTSEIASSTRMKVQLVEGLEREDFSAVAAPIYGKGFIKLYAERVGIDPAPLIREYVDVHVNKKPPSPETPDDPAAKAPAPQPSSVPDAAPPPADDLFSRAASPVRNPEATAVPEPHRPTERPPRRGHELMQRVAAGWAAGTHRARAVWHEDVAKLRDAVPEFRVDLKNIRFKDAPLKTIAVAAGILVILILILSALSRYVAAPQDEAAETHDELRLAIDPPEPYLE